MSQIKTKFIEDNAVTEAKLAADAVSTGKIVDGNVTNIKIAAGVDAVKIGDGSVSNTEFQRLNGVTGDIQTQLDAKIDDSEKGANNGVATLDAGGKVPASQLPNSVMEFKGSWDASSNSPSLADGVGNAGDVYRVGTSGTQDLGSGSVAYSVGDWVMYSGSIWQRASNTSDVMSVNGQTGVVVLDTDDIAEGTALYFTDERAQDAVGNNLLDTASVNLTYNDGTGQISADVLPAGVDHDALQNFVANEHVDHSGVAIATGVNSGLEGGGDITTTRNLAIDPDNATLVTAAAGDLILVADASDSLNLKKVTAQAIADLAATGITELTGDVTAGPGSGSQAATIAALAVTTGKIDNLAVTNAKIANATIDLTTKVTGILPVPNGGTGAASLAANNVLLGNGTSAVQVVAPGTSGNVLTSNGTTWQSAAPLAWAREEFTLSAGDITNGYITTAFTPVAASVIFVVSGLISRAGTDYTITGAQLDFSAHTPALIAGDIVTVQYQH